MNLGLGSGLNKNRPWWLRVPGLALLYHAADTATIVNVDGAASQILDKSGNGRHTTVQTDATRRPLTGTRSYNGKNLLDFDGVNDRLAFDGSFLANTNYTVFLFNEADSLTNNSIIGGSGVTTNTNLNLRHVSSTSFRFGQYSNDVTGTHTELTAPSANIWIARLDASGHALFKGDEGLLNANANTDPLVSWNGAHLGYNTAGGLYYNGAIGTLAIFNRGLTDAEINLFGGLLEAQWV